MVRTVRMGALVVTGLVMMLVAGCDGSGPDKAGGVSARKVLVLTLANPLGDSEELDGFTREVSRLSRGSIRIVVRSHWRYGQPASERGLIDDVRRGHADLGIAGARAWDSLGVNSFRALSAPLLIDSYPLQERVLQSDLVPPMLKGLAPLQLVGFGVLPGPLRHPLGIVRPLLAPTDYAALRIGVQQSRIGNMTMRALGATPVSFGAGASIAGLGGAELHIGAIQGAQYDKAGRYLTANAVLWPRPLVVFANGNAYGRLTAHDRRILALAVSSDVVAETNFLRDQEHADTVFLCRARAMRFVMAAPDQLAALRRAVQPVYAQVERDPQVRSQIAQIEVMRGASVPDKAPSCAHVPAASPAMALPAGVYQFTSGYADLRAAGAEPSELVPENDGTWTIVVAGNRFALTQDDKQACTWAYGTLATNGSTLSMSTANGGGIAPTGATDKPGELWTYRWSLFRDEVTLSRAGAVSPTPTMAKAWRWVSPTPSTHYFPKRCAPPANALPGLP